MPESLQSLFTLGFHAAFAGTITSQGLVWADDVHGMPGTGTRPTQKVEVHV